MELIGVLLSGVAGILILLALSVLSWLAVMALSALAVGVLFAPFGLAINAFERWLLRRRAAAALRQTQAQAH